MIDIVFSGRRILDKGPHTTANNGGARVHKVSLDEVLFAIIGPDLRIAEEDLENSRTFTLDEWLVDDI